MIVRMCLPAAICLMLTVTSAPANAQESVGFADPDDLEALLEYRLPDWGYRTWDAEFDFSGDGLSRHGYGGASHGGRHAWNLDSRLARHWFGERRDRSLEADLGGSYQVTRGSDPYRAVSAHRLDGDARLAGDWTEYLGGGPFSIGASAGVSGRYNESVSHEVAGNLVSDDAMHRRVRVLEFAPALGVGRLRDVTPVLRAARLSERLVALGRAPLTPAQRRTVAEVLAREHGYRQVFERPERSFWRDALEPMLEPGRPLSPWEIFFLRDVLAEDLGPRQQGQRVEIMGRYRGSWTANGSDFSSRSREIGITAAGSRNLSLAHQVGAALRAFWVVDNGGPGGSDAGAITFALTHEWNLADRCRLSSGWLNTRQYREDSAGMINRSFRSAASSVLRLRVEDSLQVAARVGGDYAFADRSTLPGEPDGVWQDGWNWSYGLSLEYALDRLLY